MVEIGWYNVAYKLYNFRYNAILFARSDKIKTPIYKIGVN